MYNPALGRERRAGNAMNELGTNKGTQDKTGQDRAWENDNVALGQLDRVVPE